MGEDYECITCHCECDWNTIAMCEFCYDRIVINDSATKRRDEDGECNDNNCKGCYSRCCLKRIYLAFCTNGTCHLNSPFNIGKIFDDEDVFCCHGCILFIIEKGLRPENYRDEWSYEDTPWNTEDYNEYYHKLKNACDEAIIKPEWETAVAMHYAMWYDVQ